MKFGPVSVENAETKVLGHNVFGPDGRRLFQKGRPLTEDDTRILASLGRSMVYVAEIEPGDVGEDQAALWIAEAVSGAGIRLSKSSTGRVNLIAIDPGVVRVDAARLEHLNSFEGITLATLETNQFVRRKQMVGTVKIIPFAVPESVVEQALSIMSGQEPLVKVDLMSAKRVGLILTGSNSSRDRLRKSFEEPLRVRITGYGSQVDMVEFRALDEEHDERILSDLLLRYVSNGMDLIILAGDTAIMDRWDIAPRAVEKAGGSIEGVGVPVDPGNLLMLGYLGNVPVLGAPGCARSLKTNAIDWLLPRLLVGERISRADLAKLGHGGLLADTSKRPMPRSRQR